MLNVQAEIFKKQEMAGIKLARKKDDKRDSRPIGAGVFDCSKTRSAKKVKMCKKCKTCRMCRTCRARRTCRACIKCRACRMRAEVCVCAFVCVVL